MSLDVTPDLLASAERGPVDEAAFVDCIRTSLPYAWETISLLVAEHAAGSSDRPFVDNQVPPPDEQARGQLLRALASDAIRGSLERHFGVILAFQNCHRVAAFAANVLGRTSRITIGTAVCMLSNRHPVALAEETALLDHLSGGRFALGVGRGGPWVDLEVFGTGLARFEDGFPDSLDLLLAGL